MWHNNVMVSFSTWMWTIFFIALYSFVFYAFLLFFFLVVIIFILIVVSSLVCFTILVATTQQKGFYIYSNSKRILYLFILKRDDWLPLLMPHRLLLIFFAIAVPVVVVRLWDLASLHTYRLWLHMTCILSS